MYSETNCLIFGTQNVSALKLISELPILDQTLCLVHKLQILKGTFSQYCRQYPHSKLYNYRTYTVL